MSFSFRIRINRAPTTTIQEEASELALSSGDQEVSVKLKATHEAPIKNAEQLSLIGSGYATAEEADTAGSRYQDALMVALAASRVGADFGHRAPKGAFTDYGLKWVEQNAGARALNNVHGLMVYETNPPPRFVSMHANAVLGANSDTFQRHFESAIEAKPSLSVRELVSFTLFNASFFQQTADSRLILLVMAIESLLELESRPDESVALVDSLIQQVEFSSLEKAERDSLASSLRWLRRESIGNAGRRLSLERLGSEEKYASVSPSKFFMKCYNMRSALVHGSQPYPEFAEVGTVAGTLEVFVSDLLTQPYLPK